MDKGTIYRPRKALETPFYKLVERHYSEFRDVYNERYRGDFGFFRDVIDQVVEKFRDCGNPKSGFARIRCEKCQHEQLVYFSCKCRGFCPSCHKKRTLVLAQYLVENVLEPVPHRQFVFTIPKRFRIYFRYDRTLLGKLSLCAWETIRQVYAEALGPENVPGMVSSIQTFGALIHFHPHIHALVSDGAFTAEGGFRSLRKVPSEVYREIFEHHVFRMLLDERRIDERVVESMKRWKHSGFSVHQEVRVAAGEKRALEKLVEYIARCPFSMSRIVKVTEKDQVLYRADHTAPMKFPGWRALPNSRMVARNYELFDPLDFVAQVTQHIPNKGEHLIHYYGYYSNKSRGMRRKKSPSGKLLIGLNEPAVGLPSRTWAMLIKKVDEVDPLICARCGGTMRIVGFISTEVEIRETLLELGVDIPSVRAPPWEATVPVETQSSLRQEPFFEDLPWGNHDMPA